ncbi:MAG: phosphomannomutase, partial [Gammaproteobacteria bacterium]|nr:phosphomannomutase [Gammaproteobacteria bacterium]
SAVASGGNPVVGYEANGGFLTATEIRRDGQVLPALPTRDTLVVMIGILLLSVQQGVPVSRLQAELPQRFTVSDRLKEFPTTLSHQKLKELHTGVADADRQRIESYFGAHFGPVGDLDNTDGLRITFTNAEIVHLRPSGNAPEFRCYTEASSESRAVEMNRICVQIMNGWRN